MARVFKRPAALRDLVDQYVYLAENAGDAIADRFLGCAEASFQLLSTQPEMGVRILTRHAALEGMRRWQVQHFERHLIFYLPRPDGIAIIRVLHAQQDWWRALGVIE